MEIIKLFITSAAAIDDSAEEKSHCIAFTRVSRELNFLRRVVGLWCGDCAIALSSFISQ